jgi:hypothetical protein
LYICQLICARFLTSTFFWITLNNHLVVFVLIVLSPFAVLNYILTLFFSHRFLKYNVNI